MAKPVAAKRPTGRPSLYTPELAETICARIASGETLIEICEDKDMPDEVTVRRWDVSDRDGFRALYTRARELQIEHEVDEIKAISNRPVTFKVITDKQHVTKDGDIIDVVEVRSGDSVEHRKLQIEARKWRAGKISAKYRERLRYREDEPDPDAPKPEVHIFELPNNGRNKDEA